MGCLIDKEGLVDNTVLGMFWARQAMLKSIVLSDTILEYIMCFHFLLCSVEVFARKFLRKHTADVHDDMFPKWLGPFFIALDIIIDSSLVLDGKITLGTWAPISDHPFPH